MRGVFCSGIVSCLLLFGPHLMAEQAKTQLQFTIGTEDIPFFPHYDFTHSQGKGFANDVIQLFAKEYGYTFTYQPLPVKRLYHELDNLVDFIYPDNPEWTKYQSSQLQRHFSKPLIYNLGTTMVLPQNRAIELSQFRTLAVIHGFTPTAWLALRKQYRFKIYDVPNAQSAISLVLKGQLDGADVEYHVASEILRNQQQPEALVVAKNLPMTRLAFHLSSARHPHVVEQFDQFLLKHQQQISELKRKYHLIDSLPEQQAAPVQP